MKGIHQSNIIIRMMQWISIDKMKRSSWFELIFWIANSKVLWILKVKGNDFESLFCILFNIVSNYQTVLIDIALLQCTCQVYTNIAVFKVNTMIIISYPRGTLFTSDISIKLSVINGEKTSSPLFSLFTSGEVKSQLKTQKAKGNISVWRSNKSMLIESQSTTVLLYPSLTTDASIHVISSSNQPFMSLSSSAFPVPPID